MGRRIAKFLARGAAGALAVGLLVAAIDLAASETAQQKVDTMRQSFDPKLNEVDSVVVYTSGIVDVQSATTDSLIGTSVVPLAGRVDSTGSSVDGASISTMLLDEAEPRVPFSKVFQGSARLGVDVDVPIPDGVSAYCNITITGGGGASGSSTDNGGYHNYGEDGESRSFTGFLNKFRYTIGRGGDQGVCCQHENHSGAGGGGGAASRLTLYTGSDELLSDFWVRGGRGGQGSYAETGALCHTPPSFWENAGTAGSPFGRQGRRAAQEHCHATSSFGGAGGTFTTGGVTTGTPGAGGASVTGAWQHGRPGNSGEVRWHCQY